MKNIFWKGTKEYRTLHSFWKINFVILLKIKKYSKHPSILRIKQYFKNPAKFSFVPVDKDVIAKEIKNLDTKKAAPQDDIPVKMLKLNNDIFS